MRRLSATADDDGVSEAVASLRVHSTLYCRSEMRAPWGFAVHGGDVAAFHLVTAGHCWLRVDEVDEPISLGIGDLVLLITGRGHQVGADPTSPTEWLDDILGRTPVTEGRLRYGGNGAVTGLVCGGFMIEGAEAHPVVLAMPPVLRIPGDDLAMKDWLDAFLALLDLEVAQPGAGGNAVLTTMANVLLAHAMRTYLGGLADADRAQVGAMRDARIAKAVQLALADPAFAWSLDKLAAEVAMSRSTFAARFRQLTGYAPMQYVTQCRLALAASYLAADDRSLFDIARRTGYQSEASFARAFSRAYGIAPGGYRRRLRLPASQARPSAVHDGAVDGPDVT